MAKRAVIFANGVLEHPEAVLAGLRGSDYLIAVDGGLRHLNRLGLTPAVLIGDLDSISAAERQAAEAAGVEIFRFPVQKDDTDLELALRLAIERGFDSIRLSAMLGGRVDHLLGNLFVLAHPMLREVEVVIDEGVEEIFLIRTQAEINGHAGDLVSLLPVNGAVEGVVTRGLFYPLANETLWPYATRGISNVMQAETAAVHIARGELLCVHIRKENNPKGIE